SAALAPAGSREEQLPLAFVLHHRRRALEFFARFVASSELREEIAAHAREKMIRRERRLVRERVDQREPRIGPVRHRDRDRAIQLDDRRLRELRERVVERDDALPIRLRGRACARMAARDRSLQRVRTEWLLQRFGARERRETATYEELIPARAILIEK